MTNNFEKLAENIPVKEILKKLSPKLWEKNELRQNTVGSPHADTKTIFLRWAKEFSVESVFTDLEAYDQDEMEEVVAEIAPAMELFHEIVKPISIGRMIIVSLKAGGRITRHFDDGEYADHYQRFHLSLRSEEGNLFYCEHNENYGEYVHMRAGELWWFNHKKYHTVYNTSNRDRIHLIIDAVSPKFKERI